MTAQGPVKRAQPDEMSHRGVPPPLPRNPWVGLRVEGPRLPLRGGGGQPPPPPPLVLSF